MANEKVEVFWRKGCGYSMKVMELFEKMEVKYKSYNIWEDDTASDEMKKRLPKLTSVPQVFIDGKHIGGCDDTLSLYKSGKLEKLLGK